MYEIIAPSGRRHSPPPGNCWKIIELQYEKLIAENRVYFGRDGNGVPRRKEFLSKAKGLVPWTWWPHDDVGHTGESKTEANELFGADVSFGTPKPERLIKRVFEIASNPGDWVLDSFGGSGTSGAVAHKMGRRWIMVELGEHCHTHIIPRLKKVIDGKDPGGITETIDWKGGGGFRYYRLAPSLLERDRWGNWVISKEYDSTMLASAMAKHEGFIYSPDETLYWKQGKSTEKDHIFTTTNFITIEYLDTIHEEMLPDESLLICCKSFQGACEDRYTNITVKKIPKMLLGRCEFGKEDYSLNITDEIQPDTEMEDKDEQVTAKKGKTGKKKRSENQASLFDKEDK
jgi:adenine-specific DNA-methyltransferase